MRGHCFEVRCVGSDGIFLDETFDCRTIEVTRDLKTLGDRLDRFSIRLSK
jgi:hypothetical protein